MSDIKTQVKEGVDEANQSFLAKFKADFKDLISGDSALKEKVTNLEKDLGAKTKEVETLKADHTKAIEAKDAEIKELKATHATELEKATNKAQTDLAKTGHNRVPADNGTGTSSEQPGAASGDIEKLRTELAGLEGKYDAASETRKSELLVKIRALKNPEAKAK
jgi:uncharacterized secreted protein with C-terminal beta-propeller domain